MADLTMSMKKFEFELEMGLENLEEYMLQVVILI